MDALKGLDSVAYVRFASIYRDFKDLPDFVKALEGLMGTAPAGPAKAVPRATRPAPAASAPPSASEALPFASTPLFPGVEPQVPASPKRRKAR